MMNSFIKMVTILDVIKRSKEKMNFIIENRNSIFKDALDLYSNNNYHSICFVGSGSSYSSILSTFLFVEKASGLSTSVMLPNLFINKEVYDENTLYVFVSQTGTSKLMIKAANKLKNLGIKTIALSSDKNSVLVKECTCFIELSIGYEEYSYATLGFTCSMLSEILFAIEIGKVNNHISFDQYNDYIEEIKKTPNSNYETIDRTISWFYLNKDKLINYENFIIYGGSSLFGVANEGALKIMEITKKYVSIGYEIDDGMHGPNYCLDERTAVLALNDNKDKTNAACLMNLMKKEYGSGYLIGLDVMDSNDLELDLKTNNFTNLEMISFVQVLSYLLAKENNVSIYEKSDPRIEYTKGKGYFNMHEVK